MNAAMQTAIGEVTRKAVAKHTKKIEDALAGLLIKGVCPSAIDLDYHPDKTVIKVNGTPRYEFRIIFTRLDEETTQ